MALVDQIFTTVLDFNYNVSFLRAMRLLKMARIIRMFRVFRFFGVLRLMLNSLVGSLLSLFWSMVMMGLFYHIAALIFVQGVVAYLQDAPADDENRNTLLRK